MRVRLIAVDLDDTLLRSDKTICPNGAEKLREAASRAIYCVIATSRRLEFVREIARQLRISNQPVICADGALIMSHPHGEIWRLLTIPQAVASAIAEAADENNWELTVVSAEKAYYRQRQGQSLGHLKDDVYVVRSNREMVETAEPIRMLVHDETAIKGIMAYLKETALAASVTIQPYFGSDKRIRSLGVFPQASDKGKALQFLGERLNIPLEDCLAIGDGSNDIPMFEVAGLSVAMANAHDEVKAFADFVCSSNDENGLAEAIEKYI